MEPGGDGPREASGQAGNMGASLGMTGCEQESGCISFKVFSVLLGYVSPVIPVNFEKNDGFYQDALKRAEQKDTILEQAEEFTACRTKQVIT